MKIGRVIVIAVLAVFLWEFFGPQRVEVSRETKTVIQDARKLVKLQRLHTRVVDRLVGWERIVPEVRYVSSEPITDTLWLETEYLGERPFPASVIEGDVSRKKGWFRVLYPDSSISREEYEWGGDLRRLHFVTDGDSVSVEVRTRRTRLFGGVYADTRGTLGAEVGVSRGLLKLSIAYDGGVYGKCYIGFGG